MISFTRASKATYIDMRGVLKTANANEPRFEKEGILIEGASTNTAPNGISTGKVSGLALNGLNLDNVTENVPSVDGANNALRLESESAGSGFYLGGVVPDAVSVTISVWLRLVSGDNRLTVGIDLDNKIVEMTDKWTRFSYTTKGEAGSGRSAIFYSKGISVWEVSFCQVEQLPFATSYIPTDGVAVTRAADNMLTEFELNLFEGFSATCLFQSYSDDTSRHQPAMSFGSGYKHFGGRNAKIGAEFPDVSIDGLVTLPIQYPTKLAFVSNTEYATLYFGAVSKTVNGKIPDSPETTNQRLRVGGVAGFSLFGHISNLRIWKIALTTKQILLL